VRRSSLVGVMECFKNCCKNFLQKNEKEERETQGEAMPQNKTEDEKRRADTDDYLLSKMPPNGREVPFVVPTLVQPRVKPPSPASQPTHHRMYLRHRCRESGLNQIVGKVNRCIATDLFDISIMNLSEKCPPPQKKIFNRTKTRKRCSHPDFFPPESISVFGDEQQLGKVCVQLSYREDLEQVWITLIQVRLPAQKVGFKGFITVPKPIQFKSCIRDYSQDVSFMQSFVFALRLEQLRSCALVLRLQVHAPRKRTVAESVLSLRRLGPKESEYWLDLNPPSKSPACHSELHLSTCFQPVNGRVQLQVLAAQSLPPTSSPLSLRFFVTAEMQQAGRKDTRKKCRAVKALEGQCRWGETFHFLLASLEEPCSLSVRLYSYSSVRRKCCLGQVLLGFDSPVPEAVEQWTDTMTHPEKVVTAWLRLSPP
uniref:Tandem C2 domains, nuclear n=1 Tax=Oryzias latipes TaxID=8090 RepID=A0A3B3IB81_ORYLA